MNNVFPESDAGLIGSSLWHFPTEENAASRRFSRLSPLWYTKYDFVVLSFTKHAFFTNRDSTNTHQTFSFSGVLSLFVIIH